jgi:pimeloyl-ACP methyl ester carboxylesterase
LQPIPPITPTQPALPQPTQANNTLIYKNIPYTSARKLDVYQPIKPGTPLLVVILHGGGGTKEAVAALSEAVSSQGAIVVAPTYYSIPPRPPDYPILKGPEDVACAVRFARTVATQLQEHPEKLVIIGHSGGGTMGADVALAGDDFLGDCLVEGGSALPDVFIGLDGAYDLVNCCIDEDILSLAPREEWDQLVPYTYVNRLPIRQGLEFHLIFGIEQALKGMALEFGAMLTSAGYPVTVSEAPGVEHDVMAYPGSSRVYTIITSVIQMLLQE